MRSAPRPLAAPWAAGRPPACAGRATPAEFARTAWGLGAWGGARARSRRPAERAGHGHRPAQTAAFWSRWLALPGRRSRRPWLPRWRLPWLCRPPGVPRRPRSSG
eukprot:15437637-Alexandrium_andersonii.AAC.1